MSHNNIQHHSRDSFWSTAVWRLCRELLFQRQSLILYLSEVLLKVAQLQALLQLEVMFTPELLEGVVGLIQLCHQPRTHSSIFSITSCSRCRLCQRVEVRHLSTVVWFSISSGLSSWFSDLAACSFIQPDRVEPCRRASFSSSWCQHTTWFLQIRGTFLIKQAGHLECFNQYFWSSCLLTAVPVESWRNDLPFLFMYFNHIQLGWTTFLWN